MKKIRVLFVAEKWCDATPHFGLTNSFHNFFNTFSQSQDDCHVNLLHLDECALVYGADINKTLIAYCKSYKTDVIIFSLLGGQVQYNPSIECYKQLREMGIYLCFLWHDSNPSDMFSRDMVYDVSNLNIVYDRAYSDFHKTLFLKPKEIQLFAPQDESLYYPDEQTIPVSFIGSLRDPNRAYFMNLLRVQLPEILITGGEREQGLTPAKYAKLIRTSKIGINFSYHAFGYWQVKGRVYEILASQSLLLESQNPSTRQLLKPDVDYVEYVSPEDLADKIRYYLAHESERKEIARAGYQTYNQNYTGKHFWDAVMQRVKQELST